jgi:hypothetical protein
LFTITYSASGLKVSSRENFSFHILNISPKKIHFSIGMLFQKSNFHPKFQLTRPKVEEMPNTRWQAGVPGVCLAEVPGRLRQLAGKCSVSVRRKNSPKSMSIDAIRSVMYVINI